MSDAGDPLPVGDIHNNPDPNLLIGNILDVSDKKSHGEDVGILKTLLTNIIQTTPSWWDHSIRFHNHQPQSTDSVLTNVS